MLNGHMQMSKVGEAEKELTTKREQEEYTENDYHQRHWSFREEEKALCSAHNNSSSEIQKVVPTSVLKCKQTAFSWVSFRLL